jgi:capsule polysaccharide export protein KpsC/LpsZ
MKFIANRFEVIDHRSNISEELKGRILIMQTESDMEIEFSEQDNGKTLKIFLTDTKENS